MSPSSTVMGEEHKVTDRYQTFLMSRRIFWVQGIYFLVTGVWPLIDLSSFQAVTGPKRDLWLVQTVGALIAVVGASLCAAGTARSLNLANYVLAVGSALALLFVDIIFTASGTIPPIYLLDGAAEFLLLLAWGTVGILALREGRHIDPRHPRHLAMVFR